jgi:hypothetical protein
MSGQWEVAGWTGWLGGVRLAADLVIVASGLSVAGVLWRLLRKQDQKATAPSPRAPRLLVASAALLSLCGISHLGVVLTGRTPTPIAPAALNGVVAALWVVTAVRFRSFVHAPRETKGRATPAADGRPQCAPDGPARLEAKVRMLEDVFNNETWLLDKADALKELRGVLAELEARECRT